MDLLVVAVGVVFLLWPLQYRWHIARIEKRLADRGEDVQRFRTTMKRVQPLVYAMPALGLLLIVVELA